MGGAGAYHLGDFKSEFSDKFGMWNERNEGSGLKRETNP